jgi:hypothetical protein
MIIYTAGSVRDLSVDAGALAGLTWFGDALWYADPARSRVVPVDPRTGESGDPVICPDLRAGLTTVAGNLIYVAGPECHLWMVDRFSGTHVRVATNPRPGSVITGMEAGRDGIWVGYRDCLELRATSDFGLRLRMPAPLGINGVTVTDRYLAYTDGLGEAITVYDTLAGRVVLSIHVFGRPTALTWDGLRLWYCDAANIGLRALDVPGMVSPT